MADNYGTKISKEGFDVKTFLTELNKKNFQILSTEDCLLRKEISDTKKSTGEYFSYKHDGSKVYPHNSYSGDAVFINLENSIT
jgi:hypothetical protein